MLEAFLGIIKELFCCLRVEAIQMVYLYFLCAL